MKGHRRSIRLRGYDYSRAGAYFVTICTQNREGLFGEIVDGEMVLNEYGNIVVGEWAKTSEIRDEIRLDKWMVMPNHFHGIIVINGGGTPRRGMARRGTARRAPTGEQFGKPVPGSLPTIVRSFKSSVTKRINEMRRTPGAKLWQRNYYEHIIRNEKEWNRVREYIINNPLKWALDRENPAATDAYPGRGTARARASCGNTARGNTPRRGTARRAPTGMDEPWEDRP